MKNNFKLIGMSIFVALMGLGFNVSPLMAQSYSQDNQSKSLIIDKQLRSINMPDYYDNISATQYTFQEDSTIEFKIIVKNNGNVDLNSVLVKDVLPNHLKLVFYPGKLENNEVSWTIDKLLANESKVFTIRALIKIDSNLLGKQINRTEAKADSLADSDTATYYIGKPTVPVTGDNSLLFKSMLIVSVIVGGVALRKVARGY